jgi:hypothetical protein
MNLVDSRGWLEYFADSTYADFYAHAVEGYRRSHRKFVVLLHNNLAGREALRRPLCYSFSLQASGAGKCRAGNQHIDALRRGLVLSFGHHPARLLSAFPKMRGASSHAHPAVFLSIRGSKTLLKSSADTIPPASGPRT